MITYGKLELNGKIIYNGEYNKLDLKLTKYHYDTDGTKVERVFDTKED